MLIAKSTQLIHISHATFKVWLDPAPFISSKDNYLPFHLTVGTNSMDTSEVI